MLKSYVIVFDLDETLGSFSQPYKFWYNLKNFLDDERLDEQYFFNFLELFPEFLRTNIFKLLKNVKQKKINNVCNNVLIYTNNNGPKWWANLIKNYFHYKLKYQLFDKIIHAFKVNGKIIEVCRTSHGKSHRDFIKCTKLPTNTKICFIDDQYHQEMHNDNVLYFQIKPYNSNIKYSTLCTQFYKYNKHLFKESGKTLDEFTNYMNHNTYYDPLAHINKSNVEKNMESMLTDHLIKEVDKFFSTNKKFTRKNKMVINKTRKR